MTLNFYPISVIPAVPHEGGIRFLCPKEQIDLGPEMADEVWSVLAQCNGRNPVSQITKASGLPLALVSQILTDLTKIGVIVDSREQYLHFHKIRNYPSEFNRNLTQDEILAYAASPRAPVKQGTTLQFQKDEDTNLALILKNRRSCRSFSKQKLTLDMVGNICHYAYSINDHAVPSGGGLYPLKIYVLVEEDQIDFCAGYYEYDAENDSLVLFNQEVDVEQLKYCFNQEEMPFGSSVQIVIAADLKRQPFKYSNRGYTLTQIEVGHAAENINLYAAEQGLGVCELGGILDEAMKMELGLEEELWPMLAMPIGFPSATKNSHEIDKIRYVEDKTGVKYPVEGVTTSTFGTNGTFFGATSFYRTKCGLMQYAGAVSSSYADAIFKATVEGYERWISGQVRSDFIGTARELEDWVHPYHHFPLSKEQIKRCEVELFTEDLPISWTTGTRFNGTKTYVPSDIVYYGHETINHRIYYGHSSGVAAYSNYAEAEKRALVELIERDALMRNWCTGNSPKIIAEDALPIHAKKRIRHWQKQGYKLMILEMPSQYGWVFEAIFVSDKYPYFVSGAAATIDKALIHDTILKALQEAEYSFLLSLEYPDATEMPPEKVLAPADHARVYHSEKNAKTLAWLWGGKESHEFADITEKSVTELKCELETITIDLSVSNYEWPVVRVLSPKLAQINFGFYTFHCCNRRDIACRMGSLKMPHYFA